MGENTISKNAEQMRNFISVQQCKVHSAWERVIEFWDMRNKSMLLLPRYERQEASLNPAIRKSAAFETILRF